MSGRDPIKVYDARWEVQEFSDEEVRRLFEATLTYGRQLGVDTVTLARDARLGAGRVMELGLETSLRLGFRVYLCPDPVSTPQSYFLALSTTRRHPMTMGLTVTASHNPKEYIGLKFTVPTVRAIGLNCGPLGGLARVREIYHSAEQCAPVAGGALHLADLREEYIEYSLRAAGVSDGELAGLRVVLDSFNGSAGPELYGALRRAGVEVDSIRLVPDGNFPTGSPNPTSQGKMDRAVAQARRGGHAAVIGVDGDGDRVVFGDGRGTLDAGFVMVPILRALGLEREPGEAVPVLYDPKVNPLALAEWGKLRIRPLLFRNGHSQIKDYMVSVHARAAAEESGHYYHRLTMGEIEVSAENSILTVLSFLGTIHAQPALMDELWDLARRVYTTGEFNYQFDGDATRDQAMEAVVRHFEADGATLITATPDGIDLEGSAIRKGVSIEPEAVRLAGSWYSGYLRVATNEKGVVRSYFSAGDPSTGRRVEEETRRILGRDFGGRVIE